MKGHMRLFILKVYAIFVMVSQIFSLYAEDITASEKPIGSSVDSVNNVSATLQAGSVKTDDVKTSLLEMYMVLLSDIKVKAPSTVAVFPLECNNKESSSGRMVAEYGISFFQRHPNFTVVDRENFNALLKELELSQTGLINEKIAIESGKMLAAEYILSGFVEETKLKRRISVRLINTETGEVVSTATAEMKDAKMESFLNTALGERTKAGSTIFRSVVFPGWGQFYVGHKTEGALSLLLTGGCAGTLIWSVIDMNKKSDEVNKYKDYDPSTAAGLTKGEWLVEANRAVKEKNSAIKRTNGLIGALAGVWALNIIDAAILGAIDSKKIKNLYFSLNTTSDNKSVEASFNIVFNLSK